MGNFKELKDFIVDLLNQPNLPDPISIDKERQKRGITPDQDHWVEVAPGIFSPKPVEVLRLLIQLKQRFGPQKEARLLVGDWRVEVRERLRPDYDISFDALPQHLKKIAEIGGYSTWSRFQSEGWRRVIDTLNLGGNLVITAPTGTGKSEVFLLPILYWIKANKQENSGTFLLLYPRVALLRDQLERALRYARKAKLTIGVQVEGVGAYDSLTLQNLFQPEGTRYKFMLIDCPVCKAKGENLPLYYVGPRGSNVSIDNPFLPNGREGGVRLLRCTRGHEFQMTLSRKGHVYGKPDLLLSTIESAENLYLHYETDNIFNNLLGVVLDEAHLYESLYGAHVAHLLRRIRKRRGEGRLPVLAVSATIANPASFGSKLLGGDVEVFAYDPNRHGGVTTGLEVVYFLAQHPRMKDAGSLLIQALMVLGHGVLGREKIVVAFNDSLDGVYRYQQYLTDAEAQRGLYRFRTKRDEIQYRGNTCPGTSPAKCSIYEKGECWRGLFGYKACTGDDPGELRIEPLRVGAYSSKGTVVLNEFDVIIATSSLEVGVDEKAVHSVVQYGPPRNAAALTQRRGRAAREHNTIAYNLIVLGNEAADRFVLTHRQRILDGEVEPPLNAANWRVRSLHEFLEKERRNLLNAYRETHNYPRSVALWLTHKLSTRCSEVKNALGNDVTALIFNWLAISKSIAQRGDARKKLVENLKARINERLEQVRQALEMADVLELALERFPQAVRGEAERAQEELNRFLRGESKVERLAQRFRSLREKISKIRNDLVYGNPKKVNELLSALPEFDNKSEAQQGLEDLGLYVDQIYRNLTEDEVGFASQGSVEDYKRFYFFLRELKEWLDEGYALIYPPGDLRAVLRALFFLHQGLPESHQCDSRPPALVPRAYFEHTTPLVFYRKPPRSIATVSVQGPLLTETEVPQSLEFFFPPYRLQYRYDTQEIAYMLKVKPVNGAPEAGEIELGVDVQGLRDDEGIRVQTATLRPVRTPGNGRPLVGFCKGCGEVYDLTRDIAKKKCSVCGTQLTAARLYPQPIIESRYIPRRDEPISFHLRASLDAEGGIATVRILGSEVEWREYRWANGDWFPKKGPVQNFTARFQIPLIYEVAYTHGIGWPIASLARELGVSPDVLAPTIGALLQRAIAGVTGIRPDLLKTSFNEETQTVWVWEMVDGGGGITGLFRSVLQENPLEVYQEMLRVASCPVYMAEAKLLKRDADVPRIPNILSDLAKEIQREAMYAKREVKSTNNAIICTKEDGCPACVRDPLSRRLENPPKRSLAVKVVNALVQQVDEKELSNVRVESVSQGLPPPFILDAHANGTYEILLL